MIKKTLILFFLIIFPAVSSFTFVLRSQGEFALGISGGYGFPQLGFSEAPHHNIYMNQSAKEYSFGILANTFVLDELALMTEITYTYNSIKIPVGESGFSWEDHFIDINITANYYWFEFLYLGAGIYTRIPMNIYQNHFENFTGKTNFTIGALIDFGADMRFLKDFALRIGLRSHIPFMGYLNKANNNYRLWAFPINFIFALEWVIN